MRNRAAFLSFFTDPLTDNAPWPSSGRLQGLTPTLKDTGKFFPAAERLSAADEAAYQEKLKPVLVYKAVKTDYLGLRKYRERGSDLGDPNYISMGGRLTLEIAFDLKPGAKAVEVRAVVQPPPITSTVRREVADVAP